MNAEQVDPPLRGDFDVNDNNKDMTGPAIEDTHLAKSTNSQILPQYKLPYLNRSLIHGSEICVDFDKER
jgi:hypothetical protein